MTPTRSGSAARVPICSSRVKRSRRLRKPMLVLRRMTRSDDTHNSQWERPNLFASPGNGVMGTMAASEAGKKRP
ncbi:hypothetical protein D3C75_1143980 [compost metagenome]